jgi:hypothetical protein
MTIQIRRASAADLHAVAELFDAYRQFYVQPADYSLAEAFLRERFADNDSVVFPRTGTAIPRRSLGKIHPSRGYDSSLPEMV